jgi:hypothetical protein
MLVAGLAVAVLSATAGLRLVGGSAFGPGGQALTPAEVQRSLAQHPVAAQSRPAAAAPATPHRAVTPPSRPSAPAPASFVSSGGTVYAACVSGQATLASWSPAQGYLIDGYSRGPATSAWVKFKSSGSEVTVTVICAGGQPRFSTAADNRGGGGRHEGGSGHGGGGGPG